MQDARYLHQSVAWGGYGAGRVVGCRLSVRRSNFPKQRATRSVPVERMQRRKARGLAGIAFCLTAIDGLPGKCRGDWVVFCGKKAVRAGGCAVFSAMGLLLKNATIGIIYFVSATYDNF